MTRLLLTPQKPRCYFVGETEFCSFGQPWISSYSHSLLKPRVAAHQYKVLDLAFSLLFPLSLYDLQVVGV